MNKKRNLPEELFGNKCAESTDFPLDADISKIKCAVTAQIKAYSSRSEKENCFMKSKKKILLIAAAVTLVLGITAVAAGRMVTGWYSSSSSITDYKTLLTSEQCEKDIGYSPILIDVFENGYAFDSGRIVSNELKGDDGSTVEGFKSVSLTYGKNSDKVHLSAEKTNAGTSLDGEIIATENNTDIYYFRYANKFVPADYKMTEEDKKAKKSGELVFSYGSDKVETIKVQSVSFIKDGVYYSLMQLDGKLTPDELSQMAKEIIAE